MPETQRQSAAGAPILTSTILGALAGAGTLAWWLWRNSKRRQLADREKGLLRLSRYQGDATPEVSGSEAVAHGEPLPERVQQLNQAIDEVRRQLEALQSQP